MANVNDYNNERSFPKFCDDCGGNVDYPRCRNLCARYTAHQMLKEEKIETIRKQKEQNIGWRDFIASRKGLKSNHKFL